MRTTLRFMSIAVALCMLALPAKAQIDFETFASASDLQDSGTLANIRISCFEGIDVGTYVFFNDDPGTEELVSYTAGNAVGSRTTVVRSASEIDGDISSFTGGNVDITACDGSVVDGSEIYLSLRGENASGDNTNWIYRTNTSGGSGTVLATIDGGNHLALDALTLYVGVVEFFDDSGNFEDGIYELDVGGSSGQTPVEVITNADLNLQDIAVGSDGNVYGTSDDNASGNFVDKIVQFDLQASAVTILADPYAQGTPFASGGVQALEIANLDGADRVYFSNNSFSSSTGEEIGLYQADGSDPLVVATQDAITSDPDVASMDIGSATAERLYLEPSTGDLFFANNEANFGDTNSIIRFTSVPLPVELATFEGQATGSGIALRWQTLSETNNAGFDVLHRAPRAADFSTAGFVSGNGTVTETTTYDFFVPTETVGTHTFRLRQVDVDGAETLSDPIEVTFGARQPLTVVGPNPARPGADLAVTVRVEATQKVDVGVYNVLGQRVASVFSGSVAPGTDLRRSIDVSTLPSGLYFIRAMGETVQATEKISVVR